MFKINIIAAIDKSGGIGFKNRIPWLLKADFKYFKLFTLDNSIVMGRKTYESIGKPLPKRNNIVLTKTNINIDGVYIANKVSDVLDLTKQFNNDLYVCGGEVVYKNFMPLADRMIITMVDGLYDTDTKFVFNQHQLNNEISQFGWKFDELIHEQKKDENNECDFAIKTYKRIN